MEAPSRQTLRPLFHRSSPFGPWLRQSTVDHRRSDAHGGHIQAMKSFVAEHPLHILRHEDKFGEASRTAFRDETKRWTHPVRWSRSRSPLPRCSAILTCAVHNTTSPGSGSMLRRRTRNFRGVTCRHRLRLLVLERPFVSALVADCNQSSRVIDRPGPAAWRVCGDDRWHGSFADVGLSERLSFRPRGRWRPRRGTKYRPARCR